MQLGSTSRLRSNKGLRTVRVELMRQSRTSKGGGRKRTEAGGAMCTVPYLPFLEQSAIPAPRRHPLSFHYSTSLPSSHSHSGTRRQQLLHYARWQRTTPPETINRSGSSTCRARSATWSTALCRSSTPCRSTSTRRHPEYRISGNCGIETLLVSRQFKIEIEKEAYLHTEITVSSCLLYTSPSPRDGLLSRMPSSA